MEKLAVLKHTMLGDRNLKYDKCKKALQSVRIKLYTVFYGAKVKGGEIIGRKKARGSSC